MKVFFETSHGSLVGRWGRGGGGSYIEYLRFLRKRAGRVCVGSCELPGGSGWGWGERGSRGEHRKCLG